MKEKIRCIVVVIVVALFLVQCQTNAQQTHDSRLARDRSTLVGLQGVGLHVNEINQGVEEHGVTRKMLHTLVEMRLRQAGIRVIPYKEMEKGLGLPYIRLAVTMAKCGNVWAFSATLYLHQGVALIRNPRIVDNRGITWMTGSVAGSPTEHTENAVRVRVNELMDQFINDYLAANPKLEAQVQRETSKEADPRRRVRLTKPTSTEEETQKFRAEPGPIYGREATSEELMALQAKRGAVQVVPNRSIAGVALGMTYSQVVSILGEPSEKWSAADISKIGEFRVLGGEKYEGVVPKMSFLHYTKPPLVVVLHENSRVALLQLGYTDNVLVEGYSFLKFRYLTQKQIDSIGKPSSVVRDKESEKRMLSMAPTGAMIEYYVYEYKGMGLKLGLIFDRTKEQKSKRFIGLNYIAISQNELMPSSEK